MMEQARECRKGGGGERSVLVERGQRREGGGLWAVGTGKALRSGKICGVAGYGGGSPDKRCGTVLRTEYRAQSRQAKANSCRRVILAPGPRDTASTVSAQGGPTTS